MAVILGLCGNIIEILISEFLVALSPPQGEGFLIIVADSIGKAC